VECLAPVSESVADPADSPRTKSSVPKSFGTPSPSGNREGQARLKDGTKVLIAEDNTEMATFIADLLQDRAEVRIAKDGGEAYEVAEEWSPDILLSDVMMPKLDGFGLCKKIKSNKKDLDVLLEHHSIMGIAIFSSPKINNAFFEELSRLCETSEREIMAGITSLKPHIKLVRFCASSGHAYRTFSQALWTKARTFIMGAAPPELGKF